MSFDEIFDLTAGVYFNFYNIPLVLAINIGGLTIETEVVGANSIIILALILLKILKIVIYFDVRGRRYGEPLSGRFPTHESNGDTGNMRDKLVIMLYRQDMETPFALIFGGRVHVCPTGK